MGNGKGCIEWTGHRKGNSGYGIQVVKWPGGEEKREAAHRLAYMIRHRVTRYDMPRVDENNNRVECSHICHNTVCVNADHIVLEPHAINQDRLHCKNQGLCSKCHKPYCLICNLLIKMLLSHRNRFSPFVFHIRMVIVLSQSLKFAFGIE